MFKQYILTLVLVSFLIGAAYSGAATVGTASIRAPAVILENNTGSLTNITLTISTGTGNVTVIGPSSVGSTTTDSAYTAAMYAANYTSHKFSNYNYVYNIQDAGDNVSGPSAGAAMTILALSAFENRPLRPNFTMTGTISPNGTIGEIGGVYDKVGAAKNAGMRLVLVPKVSPTDPEDELYLLVQTNFGIPLVQVANISQAAYFVFNGQINGIANQTTYNFYNDYKVGQLPNATINCTVSCNDSIFKLILNATFNLTRSDINRLNSNQKFSNISAQLGRVLNQSIGIANRGYLYTGADFAFLDYVNTFYFNGYPSSRASALTQLSGIQNLCTSLTPPPLTTSNYDYVISAELRQAWGNYTISSVISSYNTSQIESDQILDELYLGAQANGWCTAANLVYNEAGSQQNSTYLAPTDVLRGIALQRIDRAAPYGTTFYFATAQKAYNQNNYPLAILDADYAFALANASSQYTLTIGQLNNLSIAVASNSTYGVWATEFAKEAQFYVAESGLANNATLSKSYAESGYAAALLAEQISNDTMTIRQNLVTAQAPAISNSDIQRLMQYITYSQELIFVLLALVVLLLIINVILIIIVINKINPVSRPSNQKRPRGRNK